ncbi:23S rRNA (adenine(2030)-N(6))-methyltransferase RlmJ [Pararhodospirillum oryzae]|uniref:Ribosomal RNA large subunit methyltransferase J n=1 Tax=Pararhodospirillum oryzae TaxID=478448 RepID=A0A512H3E1_9PROT|nr:23S rRNA (adenine(2030)-N(6))-methyltransferase RlmJ [Pararhodospirillum oryzae]GEO79979.1 ribosomal RNA large subunit methyltransferase J [Pararhodospirillum oryzae]
MNYDHAFHAGNFADVLKHACLCLCLVHLAKKDKPFLVLDTHGGQGRFDLAGPQAQRTQEAAAGIGRLLAHPGPCPESLAPYLKAVRALGGTGTGLRAYPGSPLLARTLMRAQDRLVVAELHPVHARALAALLGRHPRTRIEPRDGYAVLKALLPPPERRGLVLIDPPFEQRDEFQAMARALKGALRRWASGTYLVWYPLKEEAAVAAFLADLAPTLPCPALVATLRVRPVTAGERLAGTGLMILNPPHGLATALPSLLPWLAETLGEGGAGSWSLESLAPAAAAPRGDAPA